jgi:glycosyltransferase involved in cell wall biosynthesis
MYHLPPHTRAFIIIPSFNERPETLSKVVSELLPLPFEIILVDDGSFIPVKTDPHPGLHLVRHAHNLGQGASLQTGMMLAKKLNADLIVTFDADGQHRADDIVTLIQPILAEEADIVLGSRFLEGSLHNAGVIRRLMLFTARFVNRLFTGVQLSDAHNGLRAMNRKAIRLIELKENRMAHATEIIHQVGKHELRFREVPVHIIYSSYSRKKGQSLFNSIRIFFDLVLHKLFE